MKTPFLKIALSISLIGLVSATTAATGSVAHQSPLSVAQPQVTLPNFATLVKEFADPVVSLDVIKKLETKPASGKKNGKSNTDEKASQNGGSGFIISADGYILTNAHVVVDADEIYVRLNNKKEYPARLVGEDKGSDVALLKIDAGTLPTVRIGHPENLNVGEWVMAIGAPLGLDNTVTTGIVSAKARFVENYFIPLIQTDTAINPGNSGGPLFNLNGEVIGINSRNASASIFGLGGNIGLSFAIPIDIAMQIAEKLKTSGKVSRGRLGLVLQDVNGRLADALGLPNADGQMIVGIQKDTPAAKSGLQAGDYVVGYNGTSLKGNLPYLGGMSTPGSTSVIDVLRQGKLLQFKVGVMEMGSPESAATPQTASPTLREEQIRGLTLKELSADELKKLGVAFALMVSQSQQVGVNSGTYLTSIGNQPFTSMDNALELLKTDKPVVGTFLQKFDDPDYVLSYARLR